MNFHFRHGGVDYSGRFSATWPPTCGWVAQVTLCGIFSTQFLQRKLRNDAVTHIVSWNPLSNVLILDALYRGKKIFFRKRRAQVPSELGVVTRVHYPVSPCMICSSHSRIWFVNMNRTFTGSVPTALPSELVLGLQLTYVFDMFILTLFLIG